MKIEIKSGFRSGGAVCVVSGTFPEFGVVTLDQAGPCTWKGDTDTSFKIEIEEADPRPIFEAWFYEAGGIWHEHAKPLNAAARKLCAQPLPEGWGVSIQGIDQAVTVGDYVCDLAAGRRPTALPRREIRGEEKR